MIRTPNGLLIERMVSTMKDWRGHSLRYLFCYNGEGADESYDCGCCLSWGIISECGCPCHTRFERMAAVGDLPLLFFALAASDQLPTFPSSFEEMKKWEAEAFEKGELHYHNTNGKKAGYGQAVCSVCCPGDIPHKNIKYDSKTGVPLPPEQTIGGSIYRQGSMGCDQPNCGCTCPHTVHPVENHGDSCPMKSGCTFHSEPEPETKPHVPGRCT